MSANSHAIMCGVKCRSICYKRPMTNHLDIWFVLHTSIVCLDWRYPLKIYIIFDRPSVLHSLFSIVRVPSRSRTPRSLKFPIKIMKHLHVVVGIFKPWGAQGRERENFLHIYNQWVMRNRIKLGGGDWLNYFKFDRKKFINSVVSFKCTMPNFDAIE